MEQTSPEENSPDLHFEVSFFSDELRDELKNNLDDITYKKILSVVKNGFNCSWQDFWTYSLNCEKSDNDGFRDIDELRVFLTDIESKYKRNFSILDSPKF